MRLLTSLACLSLLAFCAAGGCGSNLQPPTHGATHSIPVTGGAPGTGGLPATGGTVGPDGNPTGGQGGWATGGGGADGGGVCGSLAALYRATLPVAQSCDAGADAGGQCGVLAWAALPVTGCPATCASVWVNDDTMLTTIRLQWLEAGCQGPGACRVDSCWTPPAGQCVPRDGGLALCETFVLI